MQANCHGTQESCLAWFERLLVSLGSYIVPATWGQPTVPSAYLPTAAERFPQPDEDCFSEDWKIIFNIRSLNMHDFCLSRGHLLHPVLVLCVSLRIVYVDICCIPCYNLEIKKTRGEEEKPKIWQGGNAKESTWCNWWLMFFADGVCAFHIGMKNSFWNPSSQE